MADYGLVPRQINALSNRVAGLGERSKRHEETMGNLQLQGAQFDANMMGLSAERAMRIEQAKREQYLNEPVTLGQAIQTSKFPDAQKAELLKKIPNDVLMVPTTRKKAFEAYQTLAKEQRDIQQKEFDRASKEKISLAGQGDKQGAIDKVVDLGDRQRIIYNDGRVEEVKKGINPSSPNSLIGASGSGVTLQGLSGQEVLDNLDPSMASQVKALAEGRMQFPAGFALKSPYWQNMISMVSQYDPSFDAINYQSRHKTRNDFTSGKSADNITSLNTAIAHLGSLDENLKKLNNSRFPSYNKFANWTGKETGNAEIQKNLSAVQANSEAVAHELAKVFRQTGMSEAEIKAWKEQISSSMTPAQQQGVIQEAISLMEGRLNALGERYNQGMGTTKNPLELLTEKSQKTIQKLMGAEREYKPEDFSVPGQGSSSRQQPENNAPPIEGAKQAPDGNWYVMQPNGKYARVDME